jgi:hypothetical protein
MIKRIKGVTLALRFPACFRPKLSFRWLLPRIGDCPQLADSTHSFADSKKQS